MINITEKQSTFRTAVAIATVRLSRQETLDAVLGKQVPKGDVFEMSKTAGLFAVKRTSDMIPDCHPLPVEYAAVRFRTAPLTIFVEVEVQTIYKTGVEVEAMHGASVVALTIYDMLKPIDKNIEITSIRLKDKKGGKSDYAAYETDLKAAILVCSDSISAGNSSDTAGKAIRGKLESCNVAVTSFVVIPDEKDVIRDKVEELSLENDVVVVTGGTGLSSRDHTPEAIRPLLDREIPGLMERARSYGQERTPYSMLSRGIAGMKGRTLILTLPGSEKAALESMNALFPYALHIFSVRDGQRHSEVQETF
jgi:molybdenum cofactor biosynthesis protein MoaC